MRDSTIFYRSFYEAIKELPPEIQSQVYTAIFEYSFNFNEVALQGLAKTIFTLIKPQLDANNKRFENGKKGGRKNQNETKKEPKVNLNETKTEANNNNNVNNNNNKNSNVNENKKSIEERKSDFVEILHPFLEKYDKCLLNEFFSYWTEHGIKDKKMRFEKQTSFDVGRRLGTWEKNNQKFKTEKNGQQKEQPYIGRMSRETVERNLKGWE